MSVEVVRNTYPETITPFVPAAELPVDLRAAAERPTADKTAEDQEPDWQSVAEAATD